MSSISVPCPKCSVIPRNGSLLRSSQQARNGMVSVPSTQPSVLAGSSRLPLLQGPNSRYLPLLKAHAHEVAVESSSNSLPVSAKTKTEDAKAVEEPAIETPVPDSVISAFMAEVSDLVKLVDSRDITELELKKNGCELIIRKKEALVQPTFIAPHMMQPPPQAMFPPQPQAVHAFPPPTPAGPSPSAAATPALPPPAKGSKSSHPPLKCPMAGTFYRSPAPGEPPFVKVGDKVKKGQVVCIIEAMKLMNEIEADQSGTVIDVLAEDGKPVSVDMPLLVIEP